MLNPKALTSPTGKRSKGAGGWAPASAAWQTRCRDLWGCGLLVETDRLVQSLSLTLHRENARAILGWQPPWKGQGLQPDWFVLQHHRRSRGLQFGFLPFSFCSGLTPAVSGTGLPSLRRSSIQLRKCLAHILCRVCCFRSSSRSIVTYVPCILNVCRTF